MDTIGGYRMTTLGISLYPEQETMEEMKAYMELASKHGFSKIFTSMFSVSGEVEEVKRLFKRLCDLAHQFRMEVCIDANAMMLETYGASASDLRVFKEIGVDEIRMDMCFGDERDQMLVDNKEGIKIQFSAFMVNVVKPVVDKLSDPTRVMMCHNFYPQRYTGVSRKDFRQINAVWKAAGTGIAAFITSNDPNAHGPWPVKDGLPTIETHRYTSISYQIRDLIAMDVDTIYVGNAFASAAELQEAKHTVEMCTIQKTKEEEKIEQQMHNLLPHLGEKKVVLRVDTIQNLSEVEKQILLSFDKHVDFGDSNEFMLRSRVTRINYGKQTIPVRPQDKKVFSKGDVLIVNDNLPHYRGELQICRSEMENDGQRNLVGHLHENEQALMELIDSGTYFAFFK